MSKPFIAEPCPEYKEQRIKDIYALIDPDKPVQVYRNLHKDCFSVRQAGIVRFHTKNLMLKNASFIVGLKGRERVLKERRKNVHAWVKGYVVNQSASIYEPNGQTLFDFRWHSVTYNPYYMDTFYIPGEDEPVKHAKWVDLAFVDGKPDILAF